MKFLIIFLVFISFMLAISENLILVLTGLLGMLVSGRFMNRLEENITKERRRT